MAINIEVKAEVKGSLTNIFGMLKEFADIDNGGGGDTGSATNRSYAMTVKSKASWKRPINYICLMALNPSSSESLEIQGTADIDAKACSVQVNSTSNAALYQNGTATLKASQINVVGSAYGSNFTPTPSVGVKPVPDPLAAKFATDYAAAWSAAVNRTAPTAGGTTTIYPGKYPGFSINNGGRVTMTAGVYFIVGGTLNIKAGGELIATDGVTIILTDANVNNPVNSSSKITVQAQGNLTIKAPASGPFAGIALAQHPNSRPGLTKTTANNIQGGGTVDLTGIVYYPQQIFYITGAGSISQNSPMFAIVANKIFVEGNGQLYVGQSADYEAAGLPALPSTGNIDNKIALQ